MILDQPERSGSVIYDGQSRLWIDVRIHSSLATYACGAMETERTLLTRLQRGCGKKTLDGRRHYPENESVTYFRCCPPARQALTGASRGTWTRRTRLCTTQNKYNVQMHILMAMQEEEPFTKS